MEKIVAELLKKKVDEVIKNFSNVHRKHNTNSESYSLDRIVALGESSACALFNKSSGKKALAFFFYVKGMNYWSYFFVSYGHIAGLEKVRLLLQEVEEHNFGANFVPTRLSEI